MKLALCLLACIGLGCVPALAAQELAHFPAQVVLVSIDALHPEALGPDASPSLDALGQRGHLSLRGRSTNPPKTLIAHSAMLTGRDERRSNVWSEAEPRVPGPTVFDMVQNRGYATGFYYSKPKLGYLAVERLDASAYAPMDALQRGMAFLQESETAFAVIHISGLDFEGPVSGWLSDAYLDILRFIDAELGELIDLLYSRGNYLLLITSDHAGHGRIHGSQHPEDFRLPLIAQSDVCNTQLVDDLAFSVDEIPLILQDLLHQCADPK